jgi:hypothetical protein
MLTEYFDTLLNHDMLPKRATADSASGPDAFEDIDGTTRSIDVFGGRELPTKSSLEDLS